MILLTLLTDFGLTDPYVAQMKATILSTVPGAQFVDISHGVQRHNIVMGSYLLETTVSFFPANSIHIAVVDPGVGGPRKPVVVACARGVLVGPDNGLLVRASQRLGFKAVYEIKNEQFMMKKISSTFQGRDIFAIAAAKIAQGSDPSEVGPEIPRLKSVDFPKVYVSRNRISCRVLYVDSFGNVVTNISEDRIRSLSFRSGRVIRLTTRDGEHEAFVVKSYTEIPSGKIGALLGSQGYFELATRNSSLAGTLGLKPLDRLEIRV